MARIDEFIRFPKTVVDLAKEINMAVDAYWNREITEAELKELIWCWAGTRMLLKADDYNITAKRLCGKKRMALVDKLLIGYQHKIN